MHYNLSNTIDLGKPIKVFTNNGVEVVGVVECNTKTGFVKAFAMLDKLPVLDVVGRSVTWQAYLSAPLRVENVSDESVGLEETTEEPREEACHVGSTDNA